MMSRFLQDEDGQILEAHSISAGLDYPGVGPEHADLGAIGRAEYLPGRTTTRRSPASSCSRETEGIVPALEPAHALAWLASEAGKSIPQGSTVLVTLSGRGRQGRGSGPGADSRERPAPSRRTSGRGATRVTSCSCRM